MCSRREREEDRPKYRSTSPLTDTGTANSLIHKRAREKLGVNTNNVKMTICTVHCTMYSGKTGFLNLHYLVILPHKIITKGKEITS